MAVTALPMVIDLRFLHPENTFSSITVSSSGIIASSILVLQNASLPIVFAFAGMLTEVRLVHPKNACSPTEVA